MRAWWGLLVVGSNVAGAAPPIGPAGVLDLAPVIDGLVTPIADGETVSIGPIHVTMRHVLRQRPLSAVTDESWQFVFTRKGAMSRTVVLDSAAPGFDAEFAGYGALFVLRPVAIGSFDIIVAAKPAPPWSRDCIKRIREAAKEAGLSSTSREESRTSMDRGVDTYATGGWMGHCGTRSKRVWFTTVRTP